MDPSPILPPGTTLIKGTPGNDTIQGTAGDDYICGLAGNDTIDASDGDDTIDGGIGSDFTTAGGGNDTITYGSRVKAVKVRFVNGSSYCNGNGDDQTAPDGGNPLPCNPSNIEGVVGVGDRIDLGAENIIGGSAADVLTGNLNDNRIDGGAGGDQISGEQGDDTVDYSSRTDAVVVTIGITRNGVTEPASNNDGNDLDGLPLGRDNVKFDIENVIGGSGDDELYGNDPFNADLPTAELNRTSGENVLDGGPGDDLMDGGYGGDVYLGGSGDDTVTYSSPGQERTTPISATIDNVGNDGGIEDSKPLSERRDFIGDEVEQIIGGKSDDLLTGSAADNVLDGREGNDAIKGEGGNDRLFGHDGNDSLEGGDGVDELAGEGGDDSPGGGPGDDQPVPGTPLEAAGLDGGPGNDTLHGGFGADAIVGGDGTDTADYHDATTPVNVDPNGAADDGTANEGDNVAGDVEGAIGGSDDDSLNGNDAGGTLDGRGGDDTFDGRGGPDTFVGGSGFDTTSYAARSAPVSVDLSSPGGDGQAGEGDSVGADVERVLGGAANDTLVGNAGASNLLGGGGADTLKGAAGFDFLGGGPGNDKLEGGADRDVLSGGDGNDSLDGGGANDTLNGDLGNDSLDGGLGADTENGGRGSDTAMYTGRSRAVSVVLDGSSNDGERNEGDLISDDVVNVKTGRGDDTIDSRDGQAGSVSCGAGLDAVQADSNDTVSSDCENKGVTASSRCSVRGSSVKMSRKGVVKLRVSCPFNSKGTIRLQTARAVRALFGADSKRKRARKLTLGRKSFSVRAGKAKTVKVKLNRKARRLVLRKKRVGVRARVVARRTSGAKTARATSTRRITIKAPGKRGRNR